MWEKPQIIRSAPGGGKSSLLRLFTPSSLRTIHALRSREYTRDLFLRLSELGAVNDDGPCVLGVLLSCAHSFGTLEDLDLDDGRKQRLFLSLLNARIVLAALHGVLDLKQEAFPGNLRSVSLNTDVVKGGLPEGLTSATGKALYDWAEGLERSVCEALDSFLPLTESRLPGHDSLLALRLIDPQNLCFGGTPVVGRVLVMLDDIHRLSPKQRTWLLDSVLALRSPVAVWVAERLEALTVDELLSSGATHGRDYSVGGVVTIEDYWRGSRASRFERLVSSVADRRAREAREVEMGRFADCLQDSLDGDEWLEMHQRGLAVVSTRVKQRVAGHHKFDSWVEEHDRRTGTPREILLAWRMLEILVERELGSSQQTFDLELDAADLEHRQGSDVRTAAELFVSREFGLPYYYGMSRLACLASSNIEQFLGLAGDLFEECASAALLKRAVRLPPQAQERILRRAIKAVWGDLPQRMRHGAVATRFLDTIGQFAEWETQRPNAPYAPGVTGIAVTMADHETLRNALRSGGDEHQGLLAEVLASCIAHNLLEVALNQKCKGRYWMVLYLNRAFCVHFNLPLQYGGWREKQLGELAEWLDRGFQPPNSEAGLFQ
jgi:hypothetical protein